MAITPAEGMLIKTLLDLAINEILTKTKAMTPEEIDAGILEAEAKTQELMNEIDSH